jgi:hypothetical protein
MLGAQKKAPGEGAFFLTTGGKGEIRTHGTPKRTPDFESGAFGHSATFPDPGLAFLACCCEDRIIANLLKNGRAFFGQH